ncbi:MAG: methyltransferase domain-containing protein [Clostridiales bacterium]|jgi:ubiquinone/menaquinone biosynthesis C-methylase UbiE|nr:methyltransferase domain-containing protein [Clostridiales bacterium]
MDVKTKSQNSFNHQADIYDSTDFSKYPRECYPYVLEALSGIKFDKVLDLGCGTGVILEKISCANNFAELYGLDLSENMIAQAKQRLSQKAKLSVGDAENLPYEKENFDLVCCIESFHHYPNPSKALFEIMRVLKTGGTFLLCDTWTKSPLRQIMNFFIRFSNDGDVHIYSEHEISKLFTETGFSVVSWKLITNHAYLVAGKKPFAADNRMGISLCPQK